MRVAEKGGKNMRFSDKLKALRRGRGISQAELAEALHISRSAVAKWENGLGMPNKDSLLMLVNYFNVSEEELLADNKDKTNKKISDRDKKVLIRAIIIMAVAFVVFMVCGIFIEPLGKAMSSGGIYIALIAVNVASIFRALAKRKEEKKEQDEGGK